MIKWNFLILHGHDTGVVFLHKPIKISVIKIRKMPAAPNRYNRLDCEFCAKSGMPIRSIFPPANTQTIPAIKSRYMGNWHLIIGSGSFVPSKIYDSFKKSIIKKSGRNIGNCVRF